MIYRKVGVRRINRIDRFDLDSSRSQQRPGRTRTEMGDDKRARSVSGREVKERKNQIGKAAEWAAAVRGNGPAC